MSNSAAADTYTNDVASAIWGAVSVQDWLSALYKEGNFMDKMNAASHEFLRTTLKNMKRQSSQPVAIIDVGCGTGNNILPIVDDADVVFGIDINPNFIDHCTTNIPKGTFVQGDATLLPQILNDDHKDILSQQKLIFCAGNTLGIVPSEVRHGMIVAMGEACTTPNDTVVLIFFNGQMFGEGLQHFYAKMPQLCGSLEGAVIDFTNCTLSTRTGYYTKWTTPLEAVSIIEDLGWELLEVKQESVALMVSARPRKIVG